MGPKKLSGAQNRKRKALKELEDKKCADSLKKLFQKSSESSNQCSSKETAAEENESVEMHSEGPVAIDLDEPIINLGGCESETTTKDPQFLENVIPDVGEDLERQSATSTAIYHEVHISEDPSKSVLIDTDPALWPTSLTTKVIDQIVETGPVYITDIEFKKDANDRHFSAEFYKRMLVNGQHCRRQWLVYSKSTNKVVCFCCKLFDRKPRSSLALEGSQDWQHMSSILKSHESSPNHFLAESKWLETQVRLKTNITIDSNMQAVMNQERQHWRGVLERLVSIVQFLAERNLAFRGSSDRLFTPNNGNFLGFVELLGKFDRVMAEHLHRVVSKETTDHYCGKTIQNEIITLMANQVVNNIVTRCNKAKYYSIILDCTPDLSHKEQMSFTIRFLDEVSDIYTVKEHFIGYRNVVDTTGKGLSESILQFLCEKDLDINNCRGQGYDNGANMAGKHNGVQVHILQKNSRAVFVPCGCHCLNLVVGDAARSSKDSKDLFGLIQCIYVLFSGSVKRWKILTDHISGLTLKPMSTTRWECRIDCLKPFRYQLGEIHEALVALSEEDNVEPNVSFEARTLSQKITDFKFIMSFIIWFDILFQINIVSKAMQRQSSDLSTVTGVIHKCLDFIRDFRENGFNMALQSAKEVAENLNLEAVFRSQKRIRVKKSCFDYEGRDEAITDPQAKFKIDFFFPLVDTALTSLGERFKQLESHNKIWGFLYDIKNNTFSREELRKSCLNLQAALVKGTESDVNGEELAQEFFHIQSMLHHDTKTPLDVLNFISKNSLTDTFPYLWVALRILLTIPVTVASGEHSFSKLKLIKTYLRSSMSDDRLTALAVLSIENDILRTLDMNATIDEFARAKSRKVMF